MTKSASPKTNQDNRYTFDEAEEDDHLALNQENKFNSSGTNADFEFDNADEVEGVNEIIAALTLEEQESIADEHMPIRHYRAEKGDTKKAIDSIKLSIAWRKEFGVTDLVQCFERNGNSELANVIRKENETGKMYVRGHDKEGRALLYMRPGKENTTDEESQLRHLVWQLEKAIACSKKKNMDKVCLLIDFDGFKMKQAPPMATCKKIIHILQAHYPERMYRAYVCNPPFIFRSLWAMIRPFVDPVTKQKVCFCNGKTGLAQIVEDMGGDDEAQHLEACAGGPEDKKPFDSKEYLALPFNTTFDEKN